MEDDEKTCCPRFDPRPWDETEHDWDDKLFIKETIPQFIHIPLPGVFGRTVSKMMKKIEESDAKPDMKDFLMLAYDPSPWKSELYINTTKEIPDAENVKLSGKFLSKVFDGPFNSIPRYIHEMDEFVKNKQEEMLRYYFYYTTCPKCAKKYGHNYIVSFAQVK